MISSRSHDEPQPQTPADTLVALRAQWRRADPQARREIEQTARAVALVAEILWSPDDG